MKKLILMAVCWVATASVSAQNFSWGPKVGLTISTISNLHADLKPSFVIGAFGELQLGGAFAIQSEILYSRQGASDKIDDFKLRYRFNYLNIPVLFKFHLYRGLSVELGPQVGFALSARIKSKDGNENRRILILDSDQYNAVDFSVTGGFSYALNSGPIVSIRYSEGFTNVLKKEIAGGRNRNRVIQISSSWKF